MEDNWIIRQEEYADFDAVDNLINISFKDMPNADGDENILVRNLRKSDDFIPELSLVAVLDNIIIGHILFSKASIGDNIILTLSIVSVAPKHQRKGVGNDLIITGHQIAERLGFKVCAVVGHEDYYPKFGYEPAKEYDITCDFGVPDNNFMIIELEHNSLSDICGVVKFAKEFYELFDNK